MVVIMGWGSGKSKDLGEVAPTTCPNCHNDVYLHQVKSNKQFSLYFVPLASYASSEYLACPICRSGIQLQKEHVVAANNMRAATTLHRQGRVAEDYYRTTVEQFWALVGRGPSGQQVLGPPRSMIRGAAPGGTSGPAGRSAGSGAGPAGATRDSPSMTEQLDGLAKLHADGTLTDLEFAAAKRKLIEG